MKLSYLINKAIEENVPCFILSNIADAVDNLEFKVIALDEELKTITLVDNLVKSRWFIPLSSIRLFDYNASGEIVIHVFYNYDIHELKEIQK